MAFASEVREDPDSGLGEGGLQSAGPAAPEECLLVVGGGVWPGGITAAPFSSKSARSRESWMFPRSAP